MWRLAIAALCLPGCAIGWRVGAGPTLDDRGRPGAQLTLGGSFGITTGDGHAVQEVVAVGGGGRLGPASPTGGVLGGFEYLSQGESVGDLTWRVGFVARLQGAADGPSFGPGVQAAMLFTNDVSGDTHRNFGGELSAMAGADGDGHAIRGLLGMALVYETNVLVALDDFIPEKH
jgi:hypothetical protein